MLDVELGTIWVVMGLLCFIGFSAYMASNNRQHMLDNPLRGALLFTAALALGPISFALFFFYASTFGTIGELNQRFAPQESLNK